QQHRTGIGGTGETTAGGDRTERSGTDHSRTGRGIGDRNARQRMIAMRKNERKPIIFRSILAGAAIAAGTIASAQVTPGGEYYIHGIYTPTIANARKIDLRPEPIDTILPELPVEYEMI